MSNPVNTPLKSLLTLTGQGAGSVDTAVFQNNLAKGIVLCLDVTAAATSPTVTFSLLAIDPVSGQKTVIAGPTTASAGLTAPAFVAAEFYPGLGATSATQCNAVVPQLYAIRVTVAVGTLSAVLSGSLQT